MAPQQDSRSGPASSYDTGLPPVHTTEEVPRWMVILGLTAALTLFVALLRYAIDLLGVVFLIILVGFSIRAMSDWLTEGESVSGWALGAVAAGLLGTSLVALWLFGASEIPAGIVGHRLPAPVLQTMAWFEAHGWGQRVLVGASGSGPTEQASRGGVSEPSSAPGSSVRAPSSAEPIDPPSLPSRSGLSRRGGGARGRSGPGTAEAATVPPGRSTSTRGSGAPTAGSSAAPPVEPGPSADLGEIATSVQLSAWPTPSQVGTSVRLTAVVTTSGSDESPVGEVVFYRDDEVLGRARLSSRPGGAVAGLSTLNLPIGEYNLTAEYLGGRGFAASRSEPIRQVVTRR
jgi:Bacterial Ig-like domain (group 3)